MEARKLLATVLALVLVVLMVPATVFADGNVPSLSAFELDFGDLAGTELETWTNGAWFKYSETDVVKAAENRFGNFEFSTVAPTAFRLTFNGVETNVLTLEAKQNQNAVDFFFGMFNNEANETVEKVEYFTQDWADVKENHVGPVDGAEHLFRVTFTNGESFEFIVRFVEPAAEAVASDDYYYYGNSSSSKPSKPATPSVPEKPTEPEAPTEPEVPGGSEEPSKPEEPKPETCAVTFIIDRNTEHVVTVNKGESVADMMPANPVRKGYTFQGWFQKNGHKFVATTIVKRDMVVVAKWEKVEEPKPETCTVTFIVKTNTGMSYETDVIVNKGESVATQMPANPTRDGYAFQGWFQKNGEKFVATTIVKHDMVVLAKWEKVEEPKPETCTVTFVVDTNTQYVVTVNKGESVATQMPAAPARDGFAFQGWFIDNGEAKFVATTIVNSDMVVVARWEKVEEPEEPETCTVTFVVDTNNECVVTVNKGESVAAQMPAAPARDGYAFQGWFIDNGAAKFVATTIVNSDMVVVARWEKVEEPEEPETCTVTFVVDTNNECVVTVNKGESVAAQMPAAPARDGYAFQGWFIDNGEAKFVATTIVNSDMVVVAKWEKVEEPEEPEICTVTFVVDTNTKHVVAVNKGESVAAQMPAAPARDGYAFQGWFIDNGAAKFVATTTVNSDMVVVARWEKVEEPEVEKFIVNFYVDGEKYASYKVEKGETLSRLPDDPERDGFIRWVYKGEDKKWHAFDSHVVITRDMKVYARFAAAHECAFEDLIFHEAVAATCDKNGIEAYFECTKCGELYANATATKKIEAPVVIPAKGHNIPATSFVDGKDATCTEDGARGYYVCKNCGEKFFDKDGKEPYKATAATIPAKGHNIPATSFVDGKDATCTEDGARGYYVCKNCGEKFFDKDGKEPYKATAATIPAKGHNIPATSFVDGKDATCTEDGARGYYVCKDCGEKFFDKDGKEPYKATAATIPAKGHNIPATSFVDGKDATCTEDGARGYYVCKDCGEKFFDKDGKEPYKATAATIPAGHELKHVAENNEVYEHYKCAACGKYFDKNETPCNATDVYKEVPESAE